jgi:ABC-type sugar transport system substrate-binding protein
MPEGTYYVGSQEVTAGELQMGYAGEKLGGKGNVAILMGGLTYEASFERSQGVKNIIESKYPDIKVLAEETAEWQREKAVSVVENWITAYGDDLDAIFANNDEMALGAINALQAAGISDVMVFGIDATPDGVKAIEDGTLTATVFQDAKGQSEGAMDFAIKAIKKEAITESVNWIPYVLVTKDNVAQYK